MSDKPTYEEIEKRIQELERKQETLRKSRDHLYLALKAARMGTFEWDIVENRSVWSEEVLHMFGTTAAEFGGNFEAYLAFVSPESREKVNETVRKFIFDCRISEVIQYEHKIIRGDGQPAWIEVRARLFADDQGKPNHFSGIGIDITERKQMEEELRDHSDRLEDLVKERTNELETALSEINTLRGILPLCSFCKKIRDDKGYWEQVDVYIYKNSDADISHSICPDCMKKHYPDINIE
jgi:PAS domain S-box-containing protein